VDCIDSLPRLFINITKCLFTFLGSFALQILAFSGIWMVPPPLASTRTLSKIDNTIAESTDNRHTGSRSIRSATVAYSLIITYSNGQTQPNNTAVRPKSQYTVQWKLMDVTLKSRTHSLFIGPIQHCSQMHYLPQLNVSITVKSIFSFGGIKMKFNSANKWNYYMIECQEWKFLELLIMRTVRLCTPHAA